jgi:hypothetical protein
MSFTDSRYDISPELDRLVQAARHTGCFIRERRDAPGIYTIIERRDAPAARQGAKVLLANADFDAAMAFIRAAPQMENSHRRGHSLSDSKLRDGCAARGLALVQRGMVFDLMQGTRSAGRNLSRSDVENWLSRKS